ncbi:MAG: hypothetical protein HGA76_04685 [Candidatus Firestonebacteria bacterium]|nr:hypothetical protein [Candidatus Firestonebacteria bacterium]
MPVTRLDLDQVALCYDLAATILFPLDTEGVWKIGYAMAKDNFNGLYKFLISIATVPFLVKQVPTIWNIYYDKGTPRAELPPEGGIGTIVVENLPELPMSIRVLTTGFIQSALEFTKVKNINVKLTSTNPQAWKWVATWEH